MSNPFGLKYFFKKFLNFFLGGNYMTRTLKCVSKIIFKGYYYCYLFIVMSDPFMTP